MISWLATKTAPDLWMGEEQGGYVTPGGHVTTIAGSSPHLPFIHDNNRYDMHE